MKKIRLSSNKQNELENEIKKIFSTNKESYNLRSLREYLDLDFEIKPAIIAIDEKGRILDQPKEKYNRAKVKEEFRRKVDEALTEIDER